MPPKLAISRKRPSALAGLSEAFGALRRGGSSVADEEGAFGHAFAHAVGAEFAVPVAGARAGLWHVLSWIRERDGGGEVVLPALTASIVPNVVVAAGFDVRFVDVDPHAFTAGHEAMLRAVGPGTRAVVATHLEGFPVRADRLRDALEGRGVHVIEDAAHALGATMAGVRAGSAGAAAIFSLGKGKQLNAIEGGVVSTGEADLARYLEAAVGAAAVPAPLDVLKKVLMVGAMRLATRPLVFDAALWPGIRAFARLGRDPLTETFSDALDPPGPEGPSAARRRLGAAQSVFGRRGLQGYDSRLRRRRDLWSRLREAARAGGVGVQEPTPDTEPAPLEVAVRTRDRSRARAALRDLGIDSQPTWMMAPFQLPAFRGPHPEGSFPVAEELARSLLYLPFYPDLREVEVVRLEGLLRRPPEVIAGAGPGKTPR